MLAIQTLCVKNVKFKPSPLLISSSFNFRIINSPSWKGKNPVQWSEDSTNYRRVLFKKMVCPKDVTLDANNCPRTHVQKAISR